MFFILNFSSFLLCFRTGTKCYSVRKKLDYLCNCKKEISNVCNVVEGHCPWAIKIVHHHANVGPWRQETSVLSGKYKTYVCPFCGWIESCISIRAPNLLGPAALRPLSLSLFKIHQNWFQEFKSKSDRVK